MAKKIYLASLSKSSGKSLIALGLMATLSREYNNPAFFKPIACLNDSETDHYLNVMHRYFDLPFKQSELFGLSWDEAAALANQDKGELFKQIIQRYKALEKKVDFVLCEGSDFTTTNNALEFELNAEMANNLGCQVLCVADAAGKTLRTIIQEIDMGLKALSEKKCEVLGIIINRVNYQDEDAWTKELQSHFNHLRFVGIVPSKPELAMPSIADIARTLNATYLTGEDMSARLVRDYSIAARHVGHFLDSKKNRTDFLVITAGDRDDVILGCSLANQSTHYPKIAGLLLTTGTKPSDNILKILEGLDYPIPILCTELDTLKTIKTLDTAQFHTRAEQTQKIQKIIEHFQHHVYEKLLVELITENTSHKLTPQMFTFNLVQKAMSDKKHIVLPEGEDIRILEAAHYILKRDIADLTILGDKANIQKMATSHGWDLSKAQILDPKTDHQHSAFSELYYDLRKHKNVNLTIAQDRLHLPTYFGTLMVHTGKADGMVSGAAHTTGETIRPALEVIKTKAGSSIVSSVFLMCLEDRVAVYGDCAVNPEPNADQLAEIALQSAQTAQQFELPVRIAMLSYSSGQSGVGESVERVRLATQKVKEHNPDLLIEGPIQYDAAVDAGVAAKKMPDSKVAGCASILIFPDLNTGNNTYKAVQRETGAIAIGPVLQGLKKPVNDLSRGCTVKDIINTIVITAIQAQKG